jgi:hypothetical protein
MPEEPAVILPELLIPPANRVARQTAMPSELVAEIVPLLLTPPAKVATLLTLTAVPVDESVPLFLTPPEKLDVSKNMSLFAEIVPLLLTPRAAFELRRKDGPVARGSNSAGIDDRTTYRSPLDEDGVIDRPAGRGHNEGTGIGDVAGDGRILNVDAVDVARGAFGGNRAGRDVDRAGRRHRPRRRPTYDQRGRRR